MITRFEIYTDLSEISDRLVVVDIGGEYLAAEVEDDQVRIVYRSELIDGLNDRAGSLIISANLERNHIKYLYAVVQSFHQLRRELKNAKKLHFQKIRKFNESKNKEEFVRKTITRIGAGYPELTEFSSLDFTSPLNVVRKESSIVVYEPENWFSEIERLAVLVHALRTESRVAMPFDYHEELIKALSGRCSSMVLGKGRWDEYCGNSTTKRKKTSFLAINLHRRKRVESQNLRISPEKLLSFSSGMVPVSPAIRLLAEDEGISPEAVISEVDKISGLAMKYKKGSWRWSRASNDVSVLLLALGEDLMRASFSAQQKRFALEYCDGEKFSFVDDLYQFNRKGSTRERLQARLNLFHQLIERFEEFEIESLEVGGVEL